MGEERRTNLFGRVWCVFHFQLIAWGHTNFTLAVSICSHFLYFILLSYHLSIIHLPFIRYELFVLYSISHKRRLLTIASTKDQHWLLTIKRRNSIEFECCIKLLVWYCPNCHWQCSLSSIQDSYTNGLIYPSMPVKNINQIMSWPL